MRFQAAESNGPAEPEPIRAGPEKPLKDFKLHSTSLPFGQYTPLPCIGGPTYVTAQTLVQQVAYTLSDRLWTYSPETFDLDLSATSWYREGAKNAYGDTPRVHTLQTRQGAASVALGYVFSKDFDLEKRHRPQSVIATTSTLQYLQSALDELSLLYTLSSPFVAHVAAIDYAGASSRLVTDYTSALSLVETLGLGLISSFSTYETQHMSLLATMFAQYVPMIHIYDGVSVARETTRVVDALDQVGLDRTVRAVQQATSAPTRKNTSLETKFMRVLKALNEELGTQYAPFEYRGHSSPDAVLVVFGTVESSLASQVAESLESDGAKFGVVSVRIYRPFMEDEFWAAFPEIPRTIGVLGQVHDQLTVEDTAVHSDLYNDVMGAVSFSDRPAQAPAVIDLKYPRDKLWTPGSIAAALQQLSRKPLTDANSPGSLELLDTKNVQQFTFWDFDTSNAASAPAAIGQALAVDSQNNVTMSTKYDNLIQGGVFRSDVRRSKKAIEAPYAINTADVAFVGELSLLNQVDISKALNIGAKLILKLPDVKDDDLEAKLPVSLRRSLCAKQVQLFILDPNAIESIADDSALETYLVQACFMRVALPTLEKTALQKLAAVNGSIELLEILADELDKALRSIEIPKSWAEVDVDESSPTPLSDILPNSFTAFDKIEKEPRSYLKDWKIPALGLAFKEAYHTRPSLRPDLSTKTYTVNVKENRRLTPLTYNRNIFHIEFDLGTSGLTYDIGEALGIHAENDRTEVADFITFYNLNPSEIVEVPSRENPSVLENRTVYQSLIQNIDIFGRPPKRFYEALAEFATDPQEAKQLLTLGGPEGAGEFKRRAEVDTMTYADILLEFPSAHPSFHDIVRIVSPMKRREYSIASCQKVTPHSVALMIVVVDWVDSKGRDRFGQATRHLAKLPIGAPVTVSVKPSVMKLPPKSTTPIIMAGLGTGLAPFRAFVQHRAWEREQGKEVGEVLLYMGSRHQREEYCYGEEWEAYQDAGIITLLGRAFSRDQPQKIYIQDRMRETQREIIDAYIKKEGAFYLCGPTWPVPDVTNVLQEAIAKDARDVGKKIDPRKEIDRLKEQLRYVLEVY
ncbi:uncharacterized protein KY384_002703 [Bacidia gigantensis]|uniref:uncharacterized protein n=1 Tax=Bacidia gigantensis TaxID=2732470 RepID=UPI001D057BE7|nr:uncharacterized protein KY384_002703 [Bacidia gigantensis]KAG8532825.1 hypothetical protein KY384_002703 [Bacidia gigantensis]